MNHTTTTIYRAHFEGFRATLASREDAIAWAEKIARRLRLDGRTLTIHRGTRIDAGCGDACGIFADARTPIYRDIVIGGDA